MGHIEVMVQSLLVCQIYLCLQDLYIFRFSLFFSPILDCLYWTIAAHCAPMDTHDIATKPSPQLMVLRHGALSGFCPIIILMKRLNAFVVGWRVGVGAVWLGGPINPLCGPSEFWSLRCCTVPVLLASSMATVTLTNCLPSWVNMLLHSSGSPFLYHTTASTTAAEENVRGGGETECLVRTVEDKLLGLKYGHERY